MSAFQIFVGIVPDPDPAFSVVSLKLCFQPLTERTTKSQKKQPHCFVIAQEHLLNDVNLHVDKCFRLLFKIPYLPLFP